MRSKPAFQIFLVDKEIRWEGIDKARLVVGVSYNDFNDFVLSLSLLFIWLRFYGVYKYIM